MSDDKSEYAAQIAERLHAWSQLSAREREQSAAELVVYVLELFQRDGVTPEVQMMALMAGVVAGKSGYNNLRTQSKLAIGEKIRRLTIGEAMEALSAGRPIPVWKGAPFSVGQKKRNQHYVWRHYLSAWANARNQIWCLRKEGHRPFLASTDNVAHRSYFYRLQELTDRDMEDVRGLFVASPQYVQDNVQKVLESFSEIFQLKRECESRQGLTEEQRAVFEVIVTNFEENLHENVEMSAYESLAALRHKDMSFIDTDEFAVFARFLALQHLRTARMEEQIQLGLRKGGISAAAVNVLRHIFADTVGFALFRDRSTLHVALFESCDGVGFITCDQPVHNTLVSPGVATERLQLYYPVSPKIALLLTTEPERPGREHVTLSREQVVRYNAMVERVAHEQIFASQESLLAGRFT